MKTKIIAFVFSVTIIVQLWVPLSLILSSEQTLISGKSFKFRTEPVDPYDAFRGKYVELNFNASELSSNIKTQGTFSSGKIAYAILAEDNNGFAKVIEIWEKKPKSGYYVKGKLGYFSSTPNHITFPFTKFFLEANKAEKTEHLYAELSRLDNLDSYAIVRVSSTGFAVIEDLIIGDLIIGRIPIKETVR